MTEKILYRVLCDEYEEVARIFFEVTETGEQIEGSHQIQKWVNSLFEENERLKKENKKQLTALKNLCDVEICEICEHQEYLTYETWFGIEYDSRCKKGFKEYNGKFYGTEILECDDFELRKELQRDD